MDLDLPYSGTHLLYEVFDPNDHLVERTAYDGEGRAMQQWLQPPSSNGHHGTSCRRLVVAPGVELLVDEHHPALRLAAGEPALTDAVRQALGRLLEGE